MTAETNGYTQLCDKCHQLIRPGEVRRLGTPSPGHDTLAFAWYGKDSTWMNQVCAECHLALRLEGVL